MKKAIIVISIFVISIFLFLISGTVTGEPNNDKCTEIRECSEFMWYDIAPVCMDNIDARVSSEECKEFIKNKYPDNYSKLERCYNLMQSYGSEYAESCSFRDSLGNNISKEECEKSLREAQENEKLSPEGYWIDYQWAGKVCGRIGMCDNSYEAYKNAIKFFSGDYGKIKKYYINIALCYDVWYGNSNKSKEFYKKAGDALIKRTEHLPNLDDYEVSAELYKVAEDYKDTCNSCLKANEYRKKLGKPLLDCKKYGCSDIVSLKSKEQPTENVKQSDYNLILSMVIIIIAIFLSAFVIWYKKFKK